MAARIRNRLLLLGALWGLLLAAPPAFVMAEGFTGLLAGALFCAVASGCVGALAAGDRAARKKRAGRSRLLSGAGTGAVQALAGGTAAALSFFVLMAVSISGYALGDPAILTSPRVFLGSFFVALSVFAYALVAGLLVGPLFGLLVNRAVGVVGDARAKEEPLGKEDAVVR